MKTLLATVLCLLVLAWPVQAQESGEGAALEIDGFAQGGVTFAHVALAPSGNGFGDLDKLLLEHVSQFSSDADALVVTPAFLHKLKEQIAEILATQGYFSPRIAFDFQTRREAKTVLVQIDPAERTLVETITIELTGALAQAAKQGDAAAIARRKAWEASWTLRAGQAFLDHAWNDAKNALLDNLRDDTYAAARVVQSEAYIDQPAHRANLSIVIDSGPPFTLGAMQVSGLQRYSQSLLQHYQPPLIGEPYRRAHLLAFQSALQNSPYFSTVSIAIEADPEQAQAVPLNASVVERRANDVGLGAGYSTNTGYRGEVNYRDRNLLGRGWDFRSAIRYEQKQQLAYADFYLPPQSNGALDSLGVLLKREDVSDLLQTTNAFGVKRILKRGFFEQQYGLHYTFEKLTSTGLPSTINRALVANTGWIWRNVDPQAIERKGTVLQADIAASAKQLLSDRSFVRFYGKAQLWRPLSQQDVLQLRLELGQVFANESSGIPEDYLFRAGGTGSIRGFAYQSIGVESAGAVFGGRVLTTASGELVHWLDAGWGVAAFADTGDAAERWRDISLKQGGGFGVRYRTPAGPIALDLGYGRQSKQFRFSFSIAVAF